MAEELQQLATQQLWRRQVAARLGGASLSVSATTGFLMVPNCSGVPTGTPASTSGSALVVDKANNRLYFYSSGAWRNAGP